MSYHRNIVSIVNTFHISNALFHVLNTFHVYVNIIYANLPNIPMKKCRHIFAMLYYIIWL